MADDAPHGGSGERWARTGALRAAIGCLVLLALLLWAVAPLFSTKLTLRTDPPGATVLLNGRVAGATPLTLRDLHPGKYSLRLEKEGFAPVARFVEVPPAGIIVQETLLRYGNGSLLVQIKPRGAEVLLDGELLGHTPLQLASVPAGVHELVVRKTNYKPYIQRVEIQAGQTLEFKDFGLEDIILAMLRGQVEREKQRVCHYMDLGHYLFVNDEMDEAAEVYAKALQVANTQMEFAADTSPEERALEARLRAEDLSRLSEEIKKKSHWPGKDVTKFTSILRQQQELVAGRNITEWTTVRESVQNFVHDGKLERAQALLLQHIAAVPNSPLVPQAYIELLQLRLRMHNMEGLRDTYARFMDLYGKQPVLLRQAANALYNGGDALQGEQRRDVLGMAEKMLRDGVALSRRGDPELLALCKLELANVLSRQGRADQAVPFYRESIAGTRDASTKELRSQLLVEALKTVHNLDEARAVLEELAKSPREEVAKKAKSDLRQIIPSPENK
ncbi:MAG: PEGA domain-containing protein [Planctomycetota bacterium]|nr:PEGA domain-containing protein [Planctomycetota bacterium]